LIEKGKSLLKFLPYFYRKRFTLKPEERVRRVAFTATGIVPLQKIRGE